MHGTERKPKRKWMFLAKLKSHDEVEHFTKSNKIWSIKSKKGAVKYYRCNAVSINGPQCESALKTVQLSQSSETNVFITTSAHNHAEINSKNKAITKDLRNKILGLWKSNLSINEIKQFLDADEIRLAHQKIRNIVNYNKRKQQIRIGSASKKSEYGNSATTELQSPSGAYFQPNDFAAVNEEPQEPVDIHTHIQFFGENRFETPIILINNRPFALNPIKFDSSIRSVIGDNV